jgi:uncharacterized protein (TIGR03435 family)
MIQRGLFAIATTMALAQTQFEVASVKLSGPGERFTSISPPGSGRFTATDVTLDHLIQMAYGVDSDYILGKPNWLSSTRYDVAAKPAGEGRLTHEELKPLLRQLLEQRFKLATHRGTQDRPGYELVVAKGGPKLTESSGTATHIYILRDGLDCQGIPAAALAGMLSRPAGRPVVDKTGLKGVYDIKLEYAPEGTGDSSRPSFFSALQDQLGLKLAPQRVTVETLTIDRVERIPTEN